MKQTILYSHGGSQNHGCEAIVRTVSTLINSKIVLFSYDIDQDKQYNLNETVSEFKTVSEINNNLPWHIIAALMKRIFKTDNFHLLYEYRNLFKSPKNSLAISIGGDNYCYNDMVSTLRFINFQLNKRNIKTILLGCSIEPLLLQNKTVVEDLRRYSVIIARESVTANALKKANIANVYLLPDPAFLLEAIFLPWNIGFDYENVVGINISPLIEELENKDNITYDNYQALIRYILDNTNYSVALIPHVVWQSSNDTKPLNKLYAEFPNNSRVTMVEDASCCVIKGYIARCKIFVGARTHATIAAYSSCVPTLVVGYSVKAVGIAKDIFGDHENFVLPVQMLKREHDLTKAFIWIESHRYIIREQLMQTMPEYMKRASKISDFINKD